MKRILFFSLLALASCSPSPAPVKEGLGKDGKVRVLLSPDADIQDYGKGVYYFRYTGELFPKALSAFIAAHPELEVLAISGDGSDTYGHHNSGYFVVFKKRL